MYRFFSHNPLSNQIKYAVNHVINQYKFNNLCNQAMSSLKSGDKVGALEQMHHLLKMQPENVYLRHQIQKISPGVQLPEIKESRCVHVG